MRRLIAWTLALAVLSVINTCVETEAAIVIITKGDKARPAELQRCEIVVAGKVALGTDPELPALNAAFNDLVDPAGGTVFITMDDTTIPADVCTAPDSVEITTWTRTLCARKNLHALDQHVTGDGKWFRFSCSGLGARTRLNVELVIICPTP